MVHVYLDDDALWKQARMLALELGIPVKRMVEDALREFVKAGGAHMSTAPEKKPRPAKERRGTAPKRQKKAKADDGRVRDLKEYEDAGLMDRKHSAFSSDGLPARCANQNCQHTRFVHKDGTGRCDHCLAACPAFEESDERTS